MIAGAWDAWLSATLVGIALAAAVFTAGHALLTRRDPRAAWGWIAVCWLFPFAGPTLYVLFGVNRLRARARQFARARSLGPVGLDHAVDVRHRADAPKLPHWLNEVARTADVLTCRALLGGNAVRELHNGDAAFPAMLAAIDAARHSVWLSTYIFDRDRVGRDFVAALARARQRGVRVRVLIDGAGERYSWPRIGDELERAGVPFARFNPLRLIPPSLHLNLRNHRKLLIIDGETAFTGGMNLSARHLVDGASWRRPAIDVHFELRGAIATQIAAVFADDWSFAANEVLDVPGVGEVAASGPASCRVITDGPSAELDQLDFVLQAALSAAREDILIMTPYFLPPPPLVAALQGAALRGVRACVLLPARNNLPYVGWATRHQVAPLLAHGVQIRYQPGPFCHSKLLVVDSRYAHIGSANWDPRSLFLNFELNVEIFDTDFATRMRDHFQSRWQAARPLTLDDLRRRRLPARLRDAFCALFSPYL